MKTRAQTLIDELIRRVRRLESDPSSGLGFQRRCQKLTADLMLIQCHRTGRVDGKRLSLGMRRVDRLERDHEQYHHIRDERTG
jgi:hypothetical protein